jgi:sugar lactone lactonase YvrE
MTNFRIVARPTRDLLGEGPYWSARAGALFWVDIVGARLWELALANDRLRSWAMPEKICWVVEQVGSDDLLAGFKSGVADLALEPLAVQPRLSPEPDRPHNRLNDAKVDPAGRLWFGSKDDRDQEATGALYSLDGQGRLRRHDDSYLVTNGPTFSPDGDWLYHTDSGRGRVYRFALRADGTLGARSLFIQFEEGWGAPDGMTTDAEGHLWIAHWGGGRVSRFDPQGRLDRSVPLPATNITSCTFAGPGLDRMFVTSASLDTDGGDAQGALFEIDPGVTGLAPIAFAG